MALPIVMFALLDFYLRYRCRENIIIFRVNWKKLRSFVLKIKFRGAIFLVIHFILYFIFISRYFSIYRPAGGSVSTFILARTEQECVDNAAI